MGVWAVVAARTETRIHEVVAQSRLVQGMMPFLMELSLCMGKVARRATAALSSLERCTEPRLGLGTETRCGLQVRRKQVLAAGPHGASHVRDLLTQSEHGIAGLEWTRLAMLKYALLGLVRLHGNDASSIAIPTRARLPCDLLQPILIQIAWVGVHGKPCWTRCGCREVPCCEKLLGATLKKLSISSCTQPVTQIVEAQDIESCILKHVQREGTNVPNAVHSCSMARILHGVADLPMGLRLLKPHEKLLQCLWQTSPTMNTPALPGANALYDLQIQNVAQNKPKLAKHSFGILAQVPNELARAMSRKQVIQAIPNVGLHLLPLSN
jgi:hypothetical protein